MKKLYFTESQIRNHLLCEGVDDLKLPKFLFDKIKKHKSFLGDNAAFPPEEDYPFDYKVLKSRYREVYENITKLNLESLEYDYLVSLLSKLIKECTELETPIRPHLCKICENAVISLLKIPAETVNLTCELVDRVEPKNHAYRTLPETSEHRNFDFEDMEDFHNVSKVVLKRRLINSLIQGISYTYSLNYDLYLSQLYKLDKRLLELYDKIIIINDYLLFLKEVKIDDKKPNQSAYVEVELGVKKDRTSIFSQAIIFPFLLMETIRGFFELFASHGLPEDNKKALYITKQADFLSAEPWDLRMGVGLWNFIGKDVEDTTILPYLFTSLCEMKVDEFNTFLQEVFAQTKKGKKLIQELINDSINEKEHFEFLDTMKQKNAEKAVIEDGDFSLDELEEYSLTENDDIENAEELEDLTMDDLNVGDDGPTILGQVNPREISFEVDSAMPSWYNGEKQVYQLIPTVNGIEFEPHCGINFRAEDVRIEGESYYQLHIYISPELRRNNIAYNLFKAFILHDYPACTLFVNHIDTFNKENNVETSGAMDELWTKLQNDNDLFIYPLYDQNIRKIGYAAEKNDTINEDIAYHGSPADFTSFDIAYINTGARSQNFGYGIYLTFDKDMAKGYAAEGGKIYSVEIPSDENAQYLYMSQQVDENILNCVKNKLFQLNIDSYTEDYEDEAEDTLWDDLNTWFPNDINGKHFYYAIDKFTNSEKETSELLLSCDIIGYKYTDYDKECVIMFSDEYIDIIQKEINESQGVILEYMSSWRDGNIHSLVDSVYNDIEPRVNSKKLSKDYQYDMNGLASTIQIIYTPINGSTSSRWKGDYNWLTNKIIINLEGNVSKQDVATAIHHEITHYIDMIRQRQANQELYKTYGHDAIQMKGNNPNVRLVNNIIYKLWDKLELNAYQSFAMYGYQYVIDYCKELEDNINQLERSVSPKNPQLWMEVKQLFRPNAQMEWQAVKNWFLKRSRLALEKFKKKALKNAYLYQQNLADGDFENKGFVPNTSDGAEIPQDIPTPKDGGGNVSTQGLTTQQRLQIMNARYLTIGVGIEQIRNTQPVEMNEEGSRVEYQGMININNEQMPLSLIENAEEDRITISIPNTPIYYDLVYSEYNKTNITRRQYVALGKILSAMYKKYDTYKKELEQQEAENAQQEVNGQQPTD